METSKKRYNAAETARILILNDDSNIFYLESGLESSKEGTCYWGDNLIPGISNSQAKPVEEIFCDSNTVSYDLNLNKDRLADSKIDKIGCNSSRSPPEKFPKCPQKLEPKKIKLKKTPKKHSCKCVRYLASVRWWYKSKSLHNLTF